MKEIKCRGCGEKVLVPVALGGGPVGGIAERTGFVWLPSADVGSAWICRKCADRLLKLMEDIQALVGELYIYPPTAQDLLKRRLDKPKKVTKG